MSVIGGIGINFNLCTTKTVLLAKDYLTNLIISYTAATRAMTTENKAITLLLLGG